MEKTVEMLTTQVQDDAALTAQEPQTLADVIGATTEQQPNAEPESADTPQSEPGWMRKRIDAAVRKANSELEAKLRAEYDAQLAPLREAQVEREADKLVADGKITDRDMALNYVRATKGMPPVAETPAQPVARDERGRFISQKPDATAAQTRAAELVAQADTILQSTGVDVMALYNTDLEVRQKVLNGEWSFVDVYKNTKKPEVPAVPTPMRSANGMGIGALDIRKMNSEQLAKLNAMLESGVKIDARK